MEMNRSQVQSWSQTLALDSNRSLQTASMLIQVMLRSVGVRFGDERNRVGKTFMFAAIIASFFYTVYYVVWPDGDLDRPKYQSSIRSTTEVFNVGVLTLMYLWILRCSKPIEPLIKVNRPDQLLFVLCLLGEVIILGSDIFDFPWDDARHILLDLGAILYSVLKLFGRASTLLLCGVLRTVLHRNYAAMNSSSSFELMCTAVCRELAEMNASVSLPLIALHAHYFIWSFAGFACDLPLLVCRDEKSVHFVLEALMTSIPLLYVQYPGALIGDQLQHLRRYARKHFLETGPATSETKIWAPACILALNGNNIGIAFHSQYVLNWRNVTRFFGVCWSTGFMLFQITVGSARQNYERFCSPEDLGEFHMV